ncbi:hypothetical protein K7432_003691 [Basidiobolus ranarum]|uniref:Transmembrane protein n=1 Tax=Basidiobolus ranarum TaxID=34480 RepID=A0ABR2W5T0_9FUNG
MASLQPSQFTPSELSAIQDMLKMTKVTMFIYTALMVVMIPNFICAIRMLFLRARPGTFTPVPWLCFLQSLSAFLLLLFSLIGYFAPFDNCAVQGRLIEAWFVIAMCSLHSLLFVKSYFALNKARWLVFIHIFLECCFIGSFIFASFKETFIRVPLEDTCLSILTEATLLAELVFDIVMNVFYSGIFVIILRKQQLNTNQAQWRSLTNDGLVYMLGITSSTTLLVILSIFLGPENMGVTLFILAVVVGSCLMTGQLWNAKQRASTTNNSYFDKQYTDTPPSDSHSRSHSHSHTNSHSHQYHSSSLGHINDVELTIGEFNMNSRLDDEAHDFQHHSVPTSRPESILLRDKHHG